MKARSRHFLILVVALIVAGCGKDKVAAPNNTGGSTNLTAKIDGVDWAASNAVSGAAGVAGTPGALGIIGAQLSGSNGVSININLFNIKGPGFYPLGVSPVIFGGTAAVVEGMKSWATDVSGLSGTITITALTMTHIA